MAYSIERPEENYEWVNLIDEPDDIVEFNQSFMSAVSIKKDWKPLRVERFSDFGPFERADFPHYGGGDPMCFRQRAAEVLEPIWRKHAELLPIVDDAGEELFFVKTLTMVDALYEDRSVASFFDDGRMMILRKPVLKRSECEGLDLFKTTSYPGRIFVGPNFVSAVEEANLVGMRLEPVELS